MPSLMDETMMTGNAGAFTFSGVRIEKLGATEYTLVTIAIDVTGSTSPFAADLRASLITAVEACRKSPRAENLLIRVITFSSSLPGGVDEVHGFKPLADIDALDYPQFQPGGCTPLFDAVYAATSAREAYGKQLSDNDYGVNAIDFYITDGDDNVSRATPAMIAAENQKAVTGETLESVVSVLIGINASMYTKELTRFQTEAGISQYIDAGDATPGKLAKLAAFVSRSVSSQAQALGSGGPSQNIDATF